MKKQLSLRLPEDIILELKKIAEETGISLNAMINIILGQYLGRTNTNIVRQYNELVEKNLETFKFN